MIRFEADSIKVLDSRAIIPGRVHQGTIRVGSVFTNVEGTEPTLYPESVSLRVERICAYGHWLDELPEGMTGELTISGHILNRLETLSFPSKFAGDA